MNSNASRHSVAPAPKRARIATCDPKGKARRAFAPAVANGRDDDIGSYVLVPWADSRPSEPAAQARASAQEAARRRGHRSSVRRSMEKLATPPFSVASALQRWASVSTTAGDQIDARSRL